MPRLHRLVRAAGRGASTFWWSLRLETRRRLAGATGAFVAMLALIGIAAPALPCGLASGKHCPPADEAQAIVPAAVLAYVHIDLDPERDQLAAAGEALARVPTLAQEILGGPLDHLHVGTGTLAGVMHQVGPWIGDEAALAVLPGDERVWLLAIEDPDGAGEFAETITGAAEVGEHRGIEVTVHHRRDVAAAPVAGFLAVGSEAGVRSVIDVAASGGDVQSIAEDETVREVRDELPDLRFADAYISAEGADRLIVGGPLESLAPFVSPGTTRGAGIALSAGEDELELAIRSAIDPDRESAAPGFFAAFAPFEPELPRRLAAEAIAYVGLGDPAGTVSELLGQAASGAPGIARAFEGLVRELRRDGGIDIEGELLPALGEEAALAVEPRSDAELDANAGVPFLELVARDVDSEGAREALARLQGPIAAAIDPGAGLQAPVFTDLDVGGVEAQSLRVSPTIDLTHAVVDDLAVIATDPEAIERLAGDQESLEETDDFQRATAGFPDEVSLLAFLDLRGLISAAERLGLAADPAYVAFAGEVRSLHGLGLAVRHADEMLATDARLIVGDPAGERQQPPEPGPTDLAGELAAPSPPGLPEAVDGRGIEPADLP